MQISLKSARVNAELTQREASKAIGVDITTICSWEKGRTSPKISQLKKLCDVYNVAIDDIFLKEKST